MEELKKIDQVEFLNLILETTLINEIITAESPEDLFSGTVNTDIFAPLFACYRYAAKSGELVWDDIVMLLDRIREAVISKIESEEISTEDLKA